ncbi:alpha/beta fold hydrolase [Nocardia sp. SYP-A9097]|uniref:alpha/beta hydrolase n=1 Tax=Nocardia sp. SYP-A9097 TaxID=2663237 RepID=UPI00129B316E|nr:alpha/beta hydrolase [Nocardia sp. SYP-A9097]MRH92089.1 alpha/beta fold hydrolase [Nocardia sp. SYP-A9097]
MSETKTSTVAAPGAVITYDVRQPETETAGDQPMLMLIGSPMDASGFVSLAARFPDRTVVTYDPRGTGRSTKSEPDSESTPDQHAEDLHRIIDDLGGAPVDLFGNSGGAVNALALVAQHPDQVRILVAHEPPAAQVLPDQEQALAGIESIRKTYQESGFGPAMARFIGLVSIKGEIPASFADQPVDPAMFGLPTEDDGTRADPLLGQNLITCTGYNHDFDALRAAPTRVVIAVGIESEGEFAYRGGLGVAERLGTEPVIFPSNHAGFLGGEYGQQGDPDGFAVALRKALSE